MTRDDPAFRQYLLIALYGLLACVWRRCCGCVRWADAGFVVDRVLHLITDCVVGPVSDTLCIYLVPIFDANLASTSTLYGLLLNALLI